MQISSYFDPHKENECEKSNECQIQTGKHRESLVISYRAWIVSLFSTTRAYAVYAINCLLCFHSRFIKSWEEGFEREKRRTNNSQYPEQGNDDFKA